MDERIIYFMKNYQISDLEIQDIINMAPMMEVTTYEEFAENCVLLINYGYPESDLDVLMMSNPNIFVMSAKDLEEDLKNLKAKYDDIETALKNDPFII